MKLTAYVMLTKAIKMEYSTVPDDATLRVDVIARLDSTECQIDQIVIEDGGGYQTRRLLTDGPDSVRPTAWVNLGSRA